MAIETVALQQGVEIAGVTYDGAADAWIGAWQPAANAGDYTRLKVRYGEGAQRARQVRPGRGAAQRGYVELATLSLYNTERSNANPLNIELFGSQALGLRMRRLYGCHSGGQVGSRRGQWRSGSRPGRQRRRLWTAWGSFV